PVRYRDSFGEVATAIHNDGKVLRLMLRSVEFTGSMLDDWEANEGADPALLRQFVLQRGELCDFVLEFALPIPILFQAERLQGLLHVCLTLGAPTSDGRIDRETLYLRLDVAG